VDEIGEGGKGGRGRKKHTHQRQTGLFEHGRQLRDDQVVHVVVCRVGRLVGIDVEAGAFFVCGEEGGGGRRRGGGGE
jgi:hypothetical protein